MLKQILPSLTLTLMTAASLSAQSGVLDTGFGVNGVVNQGTGNNDVQRGTAIALRPNGNIILAGTRSSGSNETNKQMACMELSPEGEVLTLNYFGAADRDEYANAVAVQADGKIILAGTSTPLGNPFATDIQLFRIQPDGTLDATFGTGGSVTTDFSQPGTPTNEAASAVSVLPNGQILISGTGDESVFDKMMLARYLDNGELDVAGFGTNGRSYSTPGQAASGKGMKVLPDGRILVVGSRFNGGDFPVLARFTAAGALDATFGTAGFAGFNGFDGIAFSLDIQTNGKIVVGNQNENGGMELLRVSSEGAFDPGFGFLGRVSTFIFPPASGITPALVLAQPDDNLVLAGTNENGQYRVLRYTPNGNPDATFGNAGSFTAPGNQSGVHAAALQPDGKILVGGFGRINGIPTMAAIRLLNEFTVAVPEASVGGGHAFVHPNPARDQATFTYALERSAAVSIKLLDARGALVRTLRGRVIRPAGTHAVQLDLSGVPAGCYVIELETDDDAQRVRVVIH